MSRVAVVSIVLGVVVVCSRGALLVAPAVTLGWFEALIATDGRIRALGAFALTLGATMAWAGTSEYTGLATILRLGGWAIVAFSTPTLVLFPTAYRAIADSVLPSSSDSDSDLAGWRLLGLIGVILGGLLIYFGALALREADGTR
jgi:hypothetical protein